MELNSRLASILSVLLSEGEVSSGQICSRLQISKRAFYYDCERLKDWLESYRLGTLELKNGACSLKTSKKRALQNLISAESTGYYLNSRERLVIELFYIAVYRKRGVVEDLCGLLKVSQNTILSDIKKNRTLLHEAGLGLEYSAQTGYLFVGEEFQIRSFLLQRLEEINTIGARKYLEEMLSKQMGSYLKKEADYVAIMQECEQIYEAVVGTTLLEQQLWQQAVIIILAYLRNKVGAGFVTDSSEMADLQTLKEYEGVKTMFARIREYLGMDMPEQEFYFVEIYFLGMRNFNFLESKTAHREVERIADKFMHCLKQMYQVDFRDYDTFRNRLIEHLTPMYYRVKYGVQEKYPLMDSYCRKYKKEYEMARNCLDMADPKLSENTIDDEIAYLSMYIGGELFVDQNRPKQGEERKILVVCSEGVATSILVRNHLLELLGDAFAIDFCSVKSLDTQDFDHYIMVVSTVRHEKLPFGTLYVSTMLKKTDKEKIALKLNEVVYSMQTACFGEVIELVRKNFSGDGRLLELNYDLLRLFCRKRSAEAQKKGQRVFESEREWLDV